MLLISCFPALSEPLETFAHVRHTWDMQAQEGSPGFCEPPLGQVEGKEGNWGWLGFYYRITALFGDVMKQHQLKILNVLFVSLQTILFRFLAITRPYSTSYLGKHKAK